MKDLALLLLAISLMIVIIAVAISILAISLDVSASDIAYFVNKKKPKVCKFCRHYLKTDRFDRQGTCNRYGKYVVDNSYCNYYEQKTDWSEE